MDPREVERIIGAILRKLDLQSVELTMHELAMIQPDEVMIYQMQDPHRYVFTRFKR